ncbi:hypothetical protein LINGRAHAP2_LOCUS11140 [Linum grandiflorum]
MLFVPKTFLKLMEELESLEETLNESIRESLGARSGRIYGGKKGAAEDEQYSSDDDDFYDRTKKPIKKKAGETQSVETADSLLDKRDAIMKEMQEKKDLFLLENNKITSETDAEPEAADELDAYMSGLSSQLVIDKTRKLENELASLQSELDRIIYLLKIADPSGEFAKKRESKTQGKIPDIPETEVSPASTENQLPEVLKKHNKLDKVIDRPARKAKDSNAVAEQSNTKEEADKIVVDAPVVKATPYVAAKPQWLGAVSDKEVKETVQEVVPSKADESDQFVDYKDRQTILQNADGPERSGLIIRKRKEIEGRGDGDREAAEKPASAELKAEDAVALLLKHEKGYHLEEEESKHESQGSKDTKRPKRVLGPQKPSFLQGESEKDLWMPPEGQSGDGRTSLNDRFGY